MLSFFSTVTTFGAAEDVTLAELAIEAFFPADGEAGEYLRGRAAGNRQTRGRPKSGRSYRMCSAGTPSSCSFVTVRSIMSGGPET